MPDPMPAAVRRRVSIGAAMAAAGVVQYAAAMALVQAKYPGYSDFANYISDLGNTATSPWNAVFNVSIILFGALAFVGIVLAWPGFPSGRTRAVGLPLLLLASVAASLVGVFPENVNPGIHDIVSLLVFAPGGIALVVLAAGMRTDAKWRWLCRPSAGLGLVTLVSLAYYIPTQANNTTWGPGLIERFIVFPIMIWGLLAAIQLRRSAAARVREPAAGPA